MDQESEMILIWVEGLLPASSDSKTATFTATSNPLGNLADEHVRRGNGSGQHRL